RDFHVTGVQTCALPIFIETKVPAKYAGMTLKDANLTNKFKVIVLTTIKSTGRLENGKMKVSKEATGIAQSDTVLAEDDILVLFEIGRASCREREEMWRV